MVVHQVAADSDAEAACENLTRQAYARWERDGAGIVSGHGSVHDEHGGSD
jgi:hypothetical protein